MTLHLAKPSKCTRPSLIEVSKPVTVFRTFQAKHALDGNTSWGVNGESGKLADMNDYGVWEPYSVKAQTIKTAIEVSGPISQASLVLVCPDSCVLARVVFVVAFADLGRSLQTAILLLRIDDIVSGTKRAQDTGAPAAAPAQESAPPPEAD